MRHLEEDVDAVDKRTADATLVAGDQSGGAGALPEGVAVVAAGARIHGAHQHEVSRKSYPSLRPADGNQLVFQWLPQHLKQGMSEFRKFVEEEDSPVTEAYLSRFRPLSATDQTSV